jgi:hypothetical protein
VKLLLVTFALQGEPENYEQFFVTLRGSVLQWWHFIAQTCVVATNLTANQLSARLLPHVNQQTDFFMVAELKPHEFQGWLPKVAWDWFNQVSNVIAAESSPAFRSCRDRRRVARAFTAAACFGRRCLCACVA